MESESPLEKKLARKGFWRLISRFAAFLALIALAIAAFAYFRVSQSRQELAQRHDSIRAAGYPATPEDLNARYGALPPAKGVPHIHRFAELWVEHDPEFERLRTFTRKTTGRAEDRDDSPETYAEIESLLANQDSALEALFRATEETQLVEGVLAPPDTRPTRGDYARLYGAQGALDAVALTAIRIEHDSARAVGAHLRTLLIAQNLCRVPSEHTTFLGLGIYHGAIDTLKRLLEYPNLSHEDLTRLRDAYAHELPVDALKGFFAVSLCRYRAIFEETFADFPSPLPTLLGFIDRPWFDYEGNVFARYSDWVILIPFESWDRVCRERDQRSDHVEELAPLAALTWPYQLRSIDSFTQCATDLRLAQTAIAVRLYEVSHGALPESLYDVAPYLPDGMSLDPYSGEPFHYSATEKDFTLYSVGLNGKDDGGAESPAPNLGDMVFHVLHAEGEPAEEEID